MGVDPSKKAARTREAKKNGGVARGCVDDGYRDLREKMEELPPGDRAELRHHLEALFGDDVDVDIQHDMVRAQQIVARGQISNDDEYAVLRIFLEHYAERWGNSRFHRKSHRPCR